MPRRLLSVTHVTYEWSTADSPLGCALVQPHGRSGYSGLGNRPPEENQGMEPGCRAEKRLKTREQKKSPGTSL